MLRVVDRDGAESQRGGQRGSTRLSTLVTVASSDCDYHRIQHELPAGHVDGLVEEEEGKNASHEGGRPNIGLLGARPPLGTEAPSYHTSEGVAATEARRRRLISTRGSPLHHV